MSIATDTRAIETCLNRKNNRNLGNVIVENPALGINLYKNGISDNLCKKVISTLENSLSGQGPYAWSGAMVTESDTPSLEHRNCLDFKIGHKNLGERNTYNAELYDIHEECFRSIFPLASDYAREWTIGVNYFEAFNFVKYQGEGKHFGVHADHGPAYVATASIVSYLNDDYDGGEIYFPRFDLTIKPEAGDTVIFPSNYIYEHASLPIKNGTKYSIVIMTDYNDRGGNKYYPYREFENSIIY
jgi:hypothetical protein